jgi:hypothetical protein
VLEYQQRKAWNAELTPLSQHAILISLNGGHVDRPHGVSMFRALPFVAQAVRLIENAAVQQWKRVGAPPFHINWEPAETFSDPQGTLAASVRESLKTEWDSVMAAKDPGVNTVADFITSGKITVTTIGADGQPASLVEPAHYFVEQIMAATGLPDWMLGVQSGTVQTLATEQKEVLIAHIEGLRRQVLPEVERIVETRMRLAGKAGRYQIGWSKITLHDAIEQARAESYAAQAEQHTVANVITMWQMGFIDQLAAAQRIDPDIKSVAVAHATPPAAPPPPAGSTGMLNPAPEIAHPQFGAKDPGG